MAVRLPRAVLAGRNREEVLAAARRVFLERGYAGASLDAIAEAAGFSKGVVYSQFESKGDLFLTLLERRIAERAAENERASRRRRGLEVVRAMLRAGRRRSERDEPWALLLLEFRIHAARDPELNRRYAELHRRTVDGVVAVLERAYAEAGTRPPASLREIALLILALGPGLLLERVADPQALTKAVVERGFERLLGFVATPARSGEGRKESR